MLARTSVVQQMIGSVTVDAGVAGEHAHRLRTEIFAKSEELLAGESLDWSCIQLNVRLRTSRESASPVATRVFPEPVGVPEDDVSIRHDLEQCFFLRGVGRRVRCLPSQSTKDARGSRRDRSQRPPELYPPVNGCVRSSRRSTVFLGHRFGHSCKRSARSNSTGKSGGDRCEPRGALLLWFATDWEERHGKACRLALPPQRLNELHASVQVLGRQNDRIQRDGSREPQARQEGRGRLRKGSIEGLRRQGQEARRIRARREGRRGHGSRDARADRQPARPLPARRQDRDRRLQRGPLRSASSAEAPPREGDAFDRITRGGSPPGARAVRVPAAPISAR